MIWKGKQVDPQMVEGCVAMCVGCDVCVVCVLCHVGGWMVQCVWRMCSVVCCRTCCVCCVRFGDVCVVLCVWWGVALSLFLPFQ